LFDKRFVEYLAFQNIVLAILAAVGLARLGLSLAGTPNATVAWLSMSAAGWAGVFYYGVAAHRLGFGSYRHLLPLAFIQMAVHQAIAVTGILLAIAGLDNVYAAPEYTFGASPWVHLAGHLTIGIVVPTLMMWGVASLVLWIARKVSGPPTRQPVAG